MLKMVEETTPAPCGRWEDISLRFEMSPAVAAALDTLQSNPEVDIILAPLPVLQLVREQPGRWSKVRGVRIKDRVQKIAHADRFCV
jgi:hypothetical protein